LTDHWIAKNEECRLLSTDNPPQLYEYTSPIDPKIQAFIDTQSPAFQEAFSQTTYNKIQDIITNTRTQRLQYNAQNCCVVVTRNDGAVISMNTCTSWWDTHGDKINTCLEPRQVWSAMKPFLYLYDFHKNWHWSTDSIVDESVSYDLWDSSSYTPKNFDLKYHGTVSYAYALWNSLNIPAIKTLHNIGVDPFLQFLKTQLQHYASW
jgi:membrane carboxypeptidase/penicillin-binding protein PbpC